MAYCQHYQDKQPYEIQRPLPSNNLEGVVEKWDEEFINIGDTRELLELVIAADYLEIGELKRLGEAKIATYLKGKTTQQMREFLGIQNNYTPEEENSIRKEYEWMIKKKEGAQ